MPYIKEDKSKWVKESYTPDWIEDISSQKFEPEIIPWLNSPQINQNISIET